MKRLLLIVMFVSTVAGCNYPRDSRTLGRQPVEYDPFDGRLQGAVFQGNLARGGKPPTDPLAILVRSEERQKEVIKKMLEHYERLVNDDQHRIEEANEWRVKFLKEHDGIAPDQTLAIENTIEFYVKRIERSNKRLEDPDKELNEPTKRAIAEGIKKDEESVGKFKTYLAEHTALEKEYDAKTEVGTKANERILQWSTRHDRISNTLQWLNQTKGDADPEINLQLRSIAELLNHEDEPTRITTMHWFADLSGPDAEQVLPRLMKIATDRSESEAVQNAAVVAVEKIETQPRQSNGQ